MSRVLFVIAAVTSMLALPASARAQNGQATAFGGVTFGDVTTSSTFGGNVAVPLVDNVQIVLEGGRMTNVLPSFVNTIIDVAVADLTRFDLEVPAWYGEAGVRLIGPSDRNIRPYVEATGGFARLSIDLSGLDSTAGALTRAALEFLNKTNGMLGAGGGVIFQGGPVVLDLGYRYKKILAGDTIQGALTGGDFSVNQVRAGVGVRF
jgi:opacity protein-like surface antigen